jgi:DNA-directed RNA polymerase subunit RPC12/RpoP
VATTQEKDQVLNQSAPDLSGENGGAHWSEEEAALMQVYTCNSCGGELVTDQNTVATHCPFCDNPVVLAGRLSGTLKPDLIIPFQLDKAFAKSAFRKHCEGKKLLPKRFSSEERLEDIKGVYIPFWLYDAEVDGAVWYDGYKSRTWYDTSYEYTEIKRYNVIRKWMFHFRKIPIDGSSKFPNDMMESIEPFDTSQAVNFQTAYLSGYMADRYDEGINLCALRATDRMTSSIEAFFPKSLPSYDSLKRSSSHIQMVKGKGSYALFPVWMLTTNWKGKKYTFAMNGQTGKFVGDLPIDRKAYWKWWGLWTLILSSGALLIPLLLNILGIL